MKQKNKEICKGCKYLVRYDGLVNLRNTCDYIFMTGHSRLLQEEKNGGYQSDACVCYERGKRRRKESINEKEKTSDSKGDYGTV